MLVQRTNLQGNHNKPEKGEGGDILDDNLY